MSAWKYHRPKFAGRAAFKTLLKRNGFNVPRDFYGPSCCIAAKAGRKWRFRFDAGVVDVSCELWDFDRWANSVDRILDIEELKVKLK
jgi:hypothetical protein